jgi:uncharacterized protein (TIGR02145 family)
MRYLVAALVFLLTVSFTAQETVTYPYNPDADNDQFVAVSDVLSSISAFGAEFLPAEIQIDGVSLLEIIQDLQNQLAAHQEAIDNNTLPDGTFNGDLLRWNGTAWIPISLLVDECGVLNGDNSTCLCDGVPNNRVTHQGHEYSTILIDDKCWFSENCRYLPEVSLSSEESDTEPYYYVYGYEGTDVTAAKSTANYETYGVLYNWPAVMIEDICPSGWHIPSDVEFTQLTGFLGGWDIAAHRMKDVDFNQQWALSSSSNSSGFTGLPGGYCTSSGFSGNGGSDGYWWSSSDDGLDTWTIQLSSEGDEVYRPQMSKSLGLSARCLKDYIDACGILNGGNSSCLDECGIPNGDNSSCADACGVPYGNNSTCLDACGIPNGDNSTCLDECGVPNGDNSTCIDACGVPNGDAGSCPCGIPNGDVSSCLCEGMSSPLITHEGYDYTTVQIGEQCWFAENCRYLPEISPLNAWNVTTPSYHVYGYFGTDVEAAQDTSTYETYGVLYNWPAVMTEGICPSGWHIPSDSEFTQLTDFLGGESLVVADALKSAYGWANGENGSNSVGFNALPGGIGIGGIAIFDNMGYVGNWWSSSLGMSFVLGSDYFGYDIQDPGPFMFLNSARCVRD